MKPGDLDRALGKAMEGSGFLADATPPSDEEDRALFLAGRGRDLLAAPLPPDTLGPFVESQRLIAGRALAMTHPEALRRWFRGVDGTGPALAQLVVAEDHERAAVRLVDVVVLPEAQGQGLGRRLVAAVLALGDGLGRAVRLEVHPANGKARRLYRAAGFREEAWDSPLSIPMVYSGTN